MYYSSANVRKRKDKKGQPWQGVLRHKDQEGKWHETKKSFSSAKSKGEAQVMLDEWRSSMEAAAQRGLVDRPETTVSDAVKNFLEKQNGLGHLSKGTYQRQLRKVDLVIEPFFEGKDFFAVTRNDVNDFVVELSRHYCASSVRDYFSMLNKTYKNAMRDGKVTANPCDLVQRPHIEQTKINYLDQEGRKKFLTALRALDPTDYRFIVGMIAYYTGMRAGEICALQWGDINFAIGRIHVQRAARTVKDANSNNVPEIKSTKTRAGKRTIPLAPQLKDALLEYLGERQPQPRDLVLEARYANPQNLCGNFYNWTVAKGVMGVQGKPISLHGLRHTFATVAVQSNVDIKSLASMLGHAKADMTLNIYASDDEQAKTLAMGRISSFWQSEEESDF